MKKATEPETATATVATATTVMVVVVAAVAASFQPKSRIVMACKTTQKRTQ